MTGRSTGATGATGGRRALGGIAPERVAGRAPADWPPRQAAGRHRAKALARSLPWAALAAVLALATPASGASSRAKAFASVPNVRMWQLANGLKVLFLADHKAPLATVQIFYHVGSKDERVGNRGVAHMFEHLMFKGSVRVPPEEHARLLKEVGGQVNAFTTEDVTAYHQTVPPSMVDFAIRLEAERMRGLRLFPSTVDSERKVVEEEKRLRIDNNPIGQAIEKFRALAYTVHPYRWTAAGVIEDLERVQPSDCQAFYDRYYQPNNATLIVVGDVSEDQVRRSAETHFGPLPRGKAPPRVTVEEPPQTEPRSATLSLDVSLPVVVGGYHIPRASDPDVPALEVLASIMSAGESSRMYRRLVRKDKLAVAAGGLAEVMEHPGLFIVFAAHLPDKNQESIRRALADEVAQVRAGAVSAGELAKAKNQLTAGFLFGLESADGVARELGLAEYVQGDWRRFLDGTRRYAAVTAADVKRVANRYLDDSKITSVTLRPSGNVTARDKGNRAPPLAPANGDGGPP